eukprot:1706498-Pyramimonas_sp.AAC.1
MVEPTQEFRGTRSLAHLRLTLLPVASTIAEPSLLRALGVHSSSHRQMIVNRVAFRETAASRQV